MKIIPLYFKIKNNYPLIGPMENICTLQKEFENDPVYLLKVSSIYYCLYSFFLIGNKIFVYFIEWFSFFYSVFGLDIVKFRGGLYGEIYINPDTMEDKSIVIKLALSNFHLFITFICLCIFVKTRCFYTFLVIGISLCELNNFKLETNQKKPEKTTIIYDTCSRCNTALYMIKHVMEDCTAHDYIRYLNDLWEGLVPIVIFLRVWGQFDLAA